MTAYQKLAVISKAACKMALLFTCLWLSHVAGAQSMPSQDGRSVAPSGGAEATDQVIEGTWQGVLPSDHSRRLVVIISGAQIPSLKEEQQWKGVFYGLDSDAPSQGRRLTTVEVDGRRVKFSIRSIDASFEGALSDGNETINGIWRQGGLPYPVLFKKASADDSWAIPAHEKTMAIGAIPHLEVATIKPSDPNHPRNGIHFKGRQFALYNQTVKGLIEFGYGMQATQIIGGPSWISADRFDIDGIPNLSGEPSLHQMQDMVRALMADRFSLESHFGRKRLDVYAVTVNRGGAKLTPSVVDPDSEPDESGNEHGMTFTNMAMTDFALAAQFMLNRPVVDETGLKGRYDFFLKWTPQANDGENVDGPPGFFTAVKEQLGLRFKPAKAVTQVILIDRVQKPSAN